MILKLELILLIYIYIIFVKRISIMNDSLQGLVSEILEYKRFLLNENAK